MKGFDVLKIKSAVKTRNKFDLSHSHLTTMDFGEIVPLMAVETVPGDKFNVGAEFFARMAPLVKPTYGKFQFKTLAGFVPYHQIAVDAEAWLAGKTTWQGQTPLHRYITVGQLRAFLVMANVSTTTGANVNNADYVEIDASGNDVYRIFTKAGKYYVKILNALGYALPANVDMQTTSTWYTTIQNTRLSAYPLLAFAKLYNDYMSQSQRFNTSQLSNFLYKCKNNISISGEYSSGAILYAGIYRIMENIKLCYENDYFTSAWQNANSALTGTESVASAGVPALGESVQTLSYDNVLTTYGGSTVQIPQRALDFLRRFDDWVRRNNYSGSREVQQIYSRFGIKPDDYRAHYAHIINTDSMPIQVGDVTATADATNVPLGDYAGKGIMSGNKGLSYEADDFGMLFVLGWFTVTPMNSYGSDRSVLRSTPLDYYNPEFDGVGADAISLGEIFASPISADTDTLTNDNQVFGFTERYNAYRYGRDKITGEFRNYRNSADMNTWHTGRLLGDVRAQGALVAQNVSVNTLPQTDSEYNRIFSVTSGDINHFYLTCRFNVNAVRPMLNLNQVPNLGEGDTTVPRNGNTVS